MIQKKKEDYQFVEGAGRPFEMNARVPIEKSDAERQQPMIIHLTDLNGQETEKGMPKNFHRKAGRTLGTFTEYWTPKRDDHQEDFDVE